MSINSPTAHVVVSVSLAVPWSLTVMARVCPSPPLGASVAVKVTVCASLMFTAASSSFEQAVVSSAPAMSRAAARMQYVVLFIVVILFKGLVILIAEGVVVGGIIAAAAVQAAALADYALNLDIDDDGGRGFIGYSFFFFHVTMFTTTYGLLRCAQAYLNVSVLMPLQSPPSILTL